MLRISQRSEAARQAREMLTEAHTACYRANTSTLGMTHGPFSKVNEVLGLIASLETTRHELNERCAYLEKQIERLSAELKEVKGDG